MAEKFSLTAASDYFKVKYGPASFNTYDSKTPFLGRVKKTYGWSGSQFEDLVPLSQGGGVGATDGTALPAAAVWKHDKAVFDAARMYARAKIDRLAIYASKNDGAFVDSLKEVVRRSVEAFSRNTERALFNDLKSDNSVGSGRLGTIDGVVTGSGTTADPYVCTISAATFKEANWEEGDVVNVESGNTDPFEVYAIVPSTRKVSLVKRSGGQIPADTDEIFMQHSEDKDILSVKGICDATSGSLYTIPVGRRWQAYQKAAAGGLTTELMDEVVLEIERKCGQMPDSIWTSHKQWRRLSALLEDQKRYEVLGPRNKKLEGKVSWKSLVYGGPSGDINIMRSRFIEDDRMYFLNSRYCEIKHMQGFGWFSDDKTVFLREADADGYEARFGGYMELWMPPTFHGVITGLT